MDNGFRGRLQPSEAAAYLLSGRATVTIQNVATGGRYTYRVSAPSTTTARGGRALDRSEPIRFVALLSGPDNAADYQFLGMIREGEPYRHGRRSRVAESAASVEVFAWAWERLLAGDFPEEAATLWHEGSCGRCGRTLTVPESVATGYGPECSERLGIERAVVGEPVAVEEG